MDEFPVYRLPTLQRTIGDLPTHLGGAVPSKTTPPEDAICPVCRRPFNVLNDPTDPTERPCRPLQQTQCRHLMGSACYKELLRRGYSRCPLCMQDVKTPIPRWLIHLFRPSSHEDQMYGYPWPLNCTWLWPGVIAADANEASEHSDLPTQEHFALRLRELFDSTADVCGGVELWWYLVSFALSWDMFLLKVQCVVMNYLSKRVEYLVGYIFGSVSGRGGVTQ